MQLFASLLMFLLCRDGLCFVCMCSYIFKCNIIARNQKGNHRGKRKE